MGDSPTLTRQRSESGKYEAAPCAKLFFLFIIGWLDMLANIFYKRKNKKNFSFIAAIVGWRRVGLWFLFPSLILGFSRLKYSEIFINSFPKAQDYLLQLNH